MTWFWILVAVALVVGLGLAARHDRRMKRDGRALKNSNDIGYESTRNTANLHGGITARSTGGVGGGGYGG